MVRGSRAELTGRAVSVYGGLCSIKPALTLATSVHPAAHFSRPTGAGGALLALVVTAAWMGRMTIGRVAVLRSGTAQTKPNAAAFEPTCGS